MASYEKYSYSGLETIIGLDLETNKCLFIIDEIKDGTISGNADIQWATGKQNRRIGYTKNNKTATVSCNSGYVIGGLIREQFGDRLAAGASEIITDYNVPEYKRIQTTDGLTITLPSTAIGESGNEIGWIYAVNSDGSQGEAYAQAATESATEFAFDGTTEITLPTGVFKPKDWVIAIYETAIDSRVFFDRSDKFAGSVKLICEIANTDACTKKVTYQKVIAPMAAISDEFNYSFGTEMSVQAFSAECMASLCGGGEADLLIWIDPQEEETVLP